MEYVLIKDEEGLLDGRGRFAADAEALAEEYYGGETAAAYGSFSIQGEAMTYSAFDTAVELEEDTSYAVVYRVHGDEDKLYLDSAWTQANLVIVPDQMTISSITDTTAKIMNIDRILTAALGHNKTSADMEKIILDAVSLNIEKDELDGKLDVVWSDPDANNLADDQVTDLLQNYYDPQLIIYFVEQVIDGEVVREAGNLGVIKVAPLNLTWNAPADEDEEYFTVKISQSDVTAADVTAILEDLKSDTLLMAGDTSLDGYMSGTVSAGDFNAEDYIDRYVTISFSEPEYVSELIRNGGDAVIAAYNMTLSDPDAWGFTAEDGTGWLRIKPYNELTFSVPEVVEIFSDNLTAEDETAAEYIMANLEREDEYTDLFGTENLEVVWSGSEADAENSIKELEAGEELTLGFSFAVTDEAASDDSLDYFYPVNESFEITIRKASVYTISVGDIPEVQLENTADDLRNLKMNQIMIQEGG